MKIRLPEQFTERLKEIFGANQFEQISKTFVERPTTFRINTLKARRDDVLEELQREGFKVKRVSWYGDAFILENRKLSELEKLPLYQEGKIYVQSLASMVPPVILNPQPGERVLDLTAAPGSKTSQMAAMMKKQGELVANDNNEIRIQKLRHNMRLLGVSEDGFFTSTQADGWKLVERYQNYFDKVLLDAPCSAEARIIATNPRTYSYWSERNIKEHAFMQRKLLFAAFEMLKPGGILVYSTCTFAPEENEEQIDRFIKDLEGRAELAKTELSQLKSFSPVIEWKVAKFTQQIKRTLRIMPTKEIEGFFVAKIIKK